MAIQRQYTDFYWCNSCPLPHFVIGYVGANDIASSSLVRGNDVGVDIDTDQYLLQKSRLNVECHFQIPCDFIKPDETLKYAKVRRNVVCFI